MTATLAELINAHRVDVDEHLDREVSVPVVHGLQCQGDVAVVPATIARLSKQATTQVPQSGVPVVRGEAGGNTHLLLADGDVRFDGREPFDGDLCLGVLTVAADATAYLAHPEHGYSGIAPGTYELRRQREQADEIRLVQD